MKKKVLHIISSTIWRGGEQQVDYLFNHQSDDCEYYLFCPENAELVKRNSNKKQNIITYKKRLGVDIFVALQLKKISTKYKIDLIHLHDSHAINTYILADLFGMNIPAVIHRHVNFPVTSTWKYKHEKIKKIICVSEVVKNQFSTFINEKKLVVVHPGINLNRFKIQDSGFKTETIKQELEIPNEAKIIGTVSALEHEKNIEEFIEIANKISAKKDDLKFIIIGDGSLKTKFLNENKNVIFLGFRNDIPNILPAFDLFLFTSKNEGFGQVILEAMASKVPVVSNNFPAVHEIISDGKNGIVYKWVDDAIQKIELLNTDTTLRTSIVENAAHFVQQFDISLMNKKIEEIYSSIFSTNK